MLDIAWPELAVIGAVALVAIGPKDLPRVMHALGRWVGKLRAFTRDIHSTMDRLSYEMEVAESLKRAEAAKAAEAAKPTAEATSSAPHAEPETK